MLKKKRAFLFVFTLVFLSSFAFGGERSLRKMDTLNVTSELVVGSSTNSVEIVNVSSGTLYIPKLAADEFYYQGVDLVGHILKTVDPHGANETITQSLTLGSGTPYVSIYGTSSGTLYIPKLQIDELYYQGVDLVGHTIKTIDPHGANEAITQSLTLGSGTVTTTMYSTVDGANVTGLIRFLATTTTPLLHTQAILLDGEDLPAASVDYEGQIRYSIVGKHFYGCDGVSWNQLDN